MDGDNEHSFFVLAAILALGLAALAYWIAGSPLFGV